MWLQKCGSKRSSTVGKYGWASTVSKCGLMRYSTGIISVWANVVAKKHLKIHFQKGFKFCFDNLYFLRLLTIYIYISICFFCLYFYILLQNFHRSNFHYLSILFLPLYFVFLYQLLIYCHLLSLIIFFVSYISTFVDNFTIIIQKFP